MIAESFEEFFRTHEPLVRVALSAEFGFEPGRDAAAEGFRYAWENWERVSGLENPAGYVYRVGQRCAIRQRQRSLPLPERPEPSRVPWVEPRLSEALAALTPHQRICVVLVYALEWRQVEIARLLGIAPTTVQNHIERALVRLRRELEVLHD